MSVPLPAGTFQVTPKCARELTSKPCYYIITTSSPCLAVIVYFLSNTKNGLEKNYRRWYKRCRITIQNKGVLTINLYNQGRGETRSERNLVWNEMVWRKGCMGCAQRLGRKTRDVRTRALTESHEIGVRRVSRDDGRKRDHLGNNAATTASCSCINGSGWGGLGLGGVGGDGEEVKEEIHWCDWFDCVVCGLTEAMELFWC
jgi:hypothetical protein